MKVKTAIEMLSKLNPDDQIAILWWEREIFSRVWDNAVEDDIPNKEKWEEVIAEWDRAEEHYTDEIWDWIHEGLLEKGAWDD